MTQSARVPDNVAVLVVTFRNVDDALGCLESLAAQSHSGFEVIFCENGGADAFAAMKAALPEKMTGGQPIKLIRADDNPGFAGGVNHCFEAAPDADAFLVLNPDARLAPDALERMVGRLAEGDVDAVGGLLHRPDGTIQAQGGIWRKPLARAVSMGIDRPLAEAMPKDAVENGLDYLLGACILLSRDFLEKVGPLREDYFLYAEEIEWCLRAKRKGMQLGYAEGALVLHAQGTTTGSGEKVEMRGRLPIFLDERNKILLTRDVYGAYWIVAALGALVGIGGRFVRRGAWRQAGYALSGWWDGVRDRRGKPDWLAA